MDVSSSMVGDVTVVALAGQLTAQTTSAPQEKILSLAEPGTKLILDMTKVTFMSSAGLRMLLTLYRTIGGKRGRILLVGLSEDIQNTMSVTGFLDLFHHHPTLEAGLAELASPNQTT